MVSPFFAGAVGGASVQIVISAVDDFSKTLAKANDSFKDFGKALEKFSVVAIAAIAGFTAYAVKQYAEVQILNKRIGFSYGDMADKVEEASMQIRRVTTLSTEEIKGAFLETKPMIEAFGLTFEQQSTLIKRAADVASASGKSFTEVLGVFESVLSGRSGPAAKTLGIIIDEDTSKMDALQKATIGYNNIASDTARVIGAGINDRDSIVGRMKLLGIATNDLVQQFGQGFTEAFVGASGSMDEFTKKLEEFNPEMQILGEGVGKTIILIGTGLANAFRIMIQVMDRTIAGFFFWKQYLQLITDGVNPIRAWNYALEITESKLKNMNNTLTTNANVIKTQNVPAINEMTNAVRSYADGISALNAGVPFTPVGKGDKGGDSSGSGGSSSGGGGTAISGKFTESGLMQSSTGKIIQIIGVGDSQEAAIADLNLQMQRQRTNMAGGGGGGMFANSQAGLGLGTGQLGGFSHGNTGGGQHGVYHDANLLISKTGEIAEFDSQDTITARKGGGGGGAVVNVYVQGSVWALHDLTRAIEKELSNILFNKVSMIG